MTTTPTTSNRTHGPSVDPFTAIAAIVGVVALALLGVGLVAVLSAFGVTLSPSAWLASFAVSVALLAVVAGIVVYGRRLNGRPRPEVQYHR